MEYNELMQSFAANVGVSALDVQDGAAALEIDGMTVGFVHDEEAGALMVVAEIGYPSPDSDGPFGSMMLKANYLFGGTDGAVICQNPDTDAYALMRSLPLVSLDVETLASAVESLLNTAERWKGILSDAGEAENAKVSQDEKLADSTPLAGFPMDGFMQV